MINIIQNSIKFLCFKISGYAAERTLRSEMFYFFSCGAVRATTKKIKHLAPKILFAAAGGCKNTLIFNGLLIIDCSKKKCLPQGKHFFFEHICIII
jgi:hypothetical protein